MSAIELDNQDEIYLYNKKAIADTKMDGASKAKFRQVTLGTARDDDQDMWLQLRDTDVPPGVTGYNYYKLFLGRSKVFPRGKAPDQYNVAVPIIPMCYTTPDRKPEHAKRPPKGWIYIVRRFGGAHPRTGQSTPELWRELESNGLGSFRDVNLNKHRGKDFRKATCQWGQRIIAPYKINGEVQQLWIAYSEVQWSWSRVQSMLAEDGELRDKRMHELDLGDCLQDFANSIYTPPPEDEKDQGELECNSAFGKAELYNLNSAPDDISKSTSESLKDDIPVVYLDNPVGIAKALGWCYQVACTEMANHVKTLKGAQAKALQDKTYDAGRWFDSAVVVNQYLEHTQNIKHYNLVSTALLNEALGTEKRDELRQKIVTTKAYLTRFLRHELEPGQQQKPSALLLALDDYFTLPPSVEGTGRRSQTTGEKEKAPHCKATYPDGWKAVTDIIRLLDKHKYAWDADLVAELPNTDVLCREDEGLKLLFEIADPAAGLPIHERLFPKAAAGDNPLAVEPQAAKPHQFKSSALRQLINKELGRALDILRNFAQQLSNVIALCDPDMIVQKSIARLGNAILDLDLELARIDIDETVLQGRDIPGNIQMYRRPLLLLGAVGSYYYETRNEHLLLKAETRKPFKVTIDAGERRLVRFEAASGGEYDIKAKSTHNSMTRTKSRRYQIEGIITLNDDARAKLFDRIGRNTEAWAALTGMVAMVETITLLNAVNTMANTRDADKDWRTIAQLLSSICDVAGALEKVVEQQTKNVKVASGATASAQNPFQRAMRTKKTDDVAEKILKDTRLKFLGYVATAGTLIDITLTIRSLTDNLKQGDDTGALGDCILLAGFALSLFSVPVLAPLVLLAGTLSKMFLLPERSPLELWLKHGPFGAGGTTHPHFRYRRQTRNVRIRNDLGELERQRCTVHQYDYFQFLIDPKGRLIDVRDPYGNDGPFRFDRDSKQVYLKANAKCGNTREILVGKIGEPFGPPEVLATTTDEQGRFMGHDPGTDLARYGHAADPEGGRTAPSKADTKWGKFRYALWCETPDLAYAALHDALYRPRLEVNSYAAGISSPHIVARFTLPLFLPGQSRLRFSYKVKMDGRERETIAIDGSDLSALKGYRLKDDPHSYELVCGVRDDVYCTVTVSARLDVYGNDSVILPCEPALEHATTKEGENGALWICASDSLRPYDNLAAKSSIVKIFAGANK